MKFNPKKLKQCRANLGLSVEKFVYEIAQHGPKISIQTYNNYEAGRTRPNVNFLAGVCQLSKEPVSSFFKQN